MDSHPAVLTASEQLTSAQPDLAHHDPIVDDTHHDPTAEVGGDTVDYVGGGIDGIGHDNTDAALEHAAQWSAQSETPDHHHVDWPTEHVDHHDGAH
jgi:hypothetical protein